MKQEYKLYQEEDQIVWKTLFERQVENLRGKSCAAYLSRVIHTEFKTDLVQTLYFELESFDQLFKEFEQFRDTIREQVA